MSTGSRQRQNREARSGAAAHERGQVASRGAGSTRSEGSAAGEESRDAKASRSSLEERVLNMGTSVAAAPVSESGLGQAYPPMGGGGATTSFSPQLGELMPSESSLDLDVTVLAFAQWVTELKSRQNNSAHQMQAEMSIVRNAITSNNTELGDFKRHSAAIQQQMQSEIIEIRESLSSVFMEVTNAVRNNAAADQDIKLKIQSLNEQAVRNETAFAQLADAADQSQSKLRNAVQEMQSSSERMRDELGTLTRHTERLETTLMERADNIAIDIDQVSQELKMQLERRKEHLKKMVNDVCGISNSLTSWMSDFTEQKHSTSEMQNKIQSSLYVLDQNQRRDGTQGVVTAVPLPMTAAPALTADAANRARMSPQPQRPTMVTTVSSPPMAIGPPMVTSPMAATPMAVQAGPRPGLVNTGVFYR